LKKWIRKENTTRERRATRRSGIRENHSGQGLPR